MSGSRGSSPAGGIGPGELVYRVGDYARFVSDMMDALPAQSIPDGQYAGTHPLQRLRVDGGEGWTAALVKAWASVGEVLAFYQERIANEGYLPSAEEDLSLRELSRLVGHKPFPGVGAEGRVAFTLADVGPREVQLAGGAKLASVPGGGRAAQSWETLEPAQLRREWNALRPDIPTHRLLARLQGHSRSIVVLDPRGAVQPGTGVVIVAGEGDEQECWTRIIDAIEAVNDLSTDPRTVRLRWAQPLDEHDPQRVVEPLQIFVLSRQFALFGHDAPDWNAVAEGRKAGFAQPRGGVITWSRHGWQSSNLGLGELSVTSLLSRPDGSMLAGTPNGVYRFRSGGMWERAGLDLTGIHVECLVADGERTVYAGSAGQGVFRGTNGEEWEPLFGETEMQPAIRVWRGRFRSGRLPGGPVRALLVAGARLYAGTDHGVFFYEAGPGTWRSASRGLPGWSPRSAHAAVVVHALSRHRANGMLHAGTDVGVFIADAEARRWQPVCEGLPHAKDDADRCTATVFALLDVEDEELRVAYLFAATGAGVFRSTHPAGRWQAVSLGLPETDVDTGLSETAVHGLATTASPRSGIQRLVAATAAGIFYSDDHGDYWERLDPGNLEDDPPPPAARPVTALTIDAQGAPVAGVALGGFDQILRPDYARADLGEGLDLAQATTRAKAGQWAALLAGHEPGQQPAVAQAAAITFRIRAADNVFRHSHLGPRRITRLSADRELQAWLEAHPHASLHLAPGPALGVLEGDFPRVEPMAQDRIILHEVGAHSAFPASRDVFVVGRRMRIVLRRAVPLQWEDGSASLPGDGEELLVTGLRQHEHSPFVRLDVRCAHGRQASLEAARADLIWVPSARRDEQVVERVRAAWVASAAAGGRPGLVFIPGLCNAFDPGDVAIQANVVRASQGSSVRVDVLGSGDSARSQQWFRFTAQPITFLRSPGPRGYRSSVEMRINGLPWDEVESLLDAGPDNHVYTLGQDSEGRTGAQFGDGLNGARLPSGRDNVVASYRTGMWDSALPANTLKVLRTKPSGMKSVTNPMRIASGGAAENAARLRRRVPLVTRTLGRIVSLSDFEDFCQDYTFIDRVRATQLVSAGGALLHLSVATTDGEPIEAGDPLHDELVSAIARSSGGCTRFKVQSVRRVAFRLELSLRARQGARWEELKAAARDLLHERYAYGRTGFEQAIVPAQILAALRALPGMLATGLDAFHRRIESGTPASVAPRLLAQPASWDDEHHKAVAAELLELDVDADLELAFESGE